jgi:hypothetical protein
MNMTTFLPPHGEQYQIKGLGKNFKNSLENFLINNFPIVKYFALKNSYVIYSTVEGFDTMNGFP